MRPQVQANSLPCKPAAATAAGRRSAHGRRADLDARTRQVVQERGDDRGRVAGMHKRRMDQVHAHHCVAQAPPHMRSRAHAMTSILSGRLTLAESHVRGWHDNHDLTLHGRSQSWHVCGMSGATGASSTVHTSRAVQPGRRASTRAPPEPGQHGSCKEQLALNRPACCHARTAHGLLLQLRALVQHADVHQHAAGLLPARPRAPSHRSVRSVHHAMQECGWRARRGGWRAGARRGLGCIFTPSQPWHSLSRLNACAPPVQSNSVSGTQRAAQRVSPPRRPGSGALAAACFENAALACPVTSRRAPQPLCARSARPPGHQPARAPMSALQPMRRVCLGYAAPWS